MACSFLYHHPLHNVVVVVVVVAAVDIDVAPLVIAAEIVACRSHQRTIVAVAGETAAVTDDRHCCYRCHWPGDFAYCINNRMRYDTCDDIFINIGRC